MTISTMQNQTLVAFVAGMWISIQFSTFIPDGYIMTCFNDSMHTATPGDLELAQFCGDGICMLVLDTRVSFLFAALINLPTYT